VCPRGLESNLATNRHTRRIYRRGFTEFISRVISALGYLPLWGNSKLYIRVRSLPGVSPKPAFGLILDSTSRCRGRWVCLCCVCVCVVCVNSRRLQHRHSQVSGSVGLFVLCVCVTCVCDLCSLEQTDTLTDSTHTSYITITRSTCKKFNRSHAHAAANKPLTTHTTHEHRASNGAKTTTLNSRSRRRRPQAAAQRCTSALEPAEHQRNWPPPRENNSHRSSSRLKGGSARLVPVPQRMVPF